jgi:hypothetical protein
VAMEWAMMLERIANEVIDDVRLETDESLGDLRFRALMPPEEWASLPLPIRRRFSKRLAGGKTVVYVGEILETRLSRAGWCLAQLARLIGAPLPTSADSKVPMIVTVTEDMTTSGQVWTRLCTRRNGFPQIINSSKRFSGPTGIEEYLGYGLSMAMTIHARDGALVFRSDSYFLNVFGRRFALPFWLKPGVVTVTHSELGEGRFIFTLEVKHPRLGMLIHQSAAFREASP